MKNFMNLILLMFFMLFMLFCTFNSTFMSLDYFLFEKFFFSMNFSFIINMDNLLMLFMICFVTMFVMMFSEIYMESYNVKMFFIILIFFFLSMFLLIFSCSNLSIIMSWDILGLSSVYLIKFYPNEVSIFNSMFTMLFNRLGDFFLLISVIMIMSKSCNFIFFFEESIIMFLLILCIMTKSAQFPMSTWLPLAMSAPTPISTMVHSSTLVTVGVIILFKYLDLFYTSYFFYLFYILSCITFLIGGIMACYEMDFKKIVAFSTMSQISMIMLFLSFNFKIFSIMHMLFHAYFKSFLFGCSGMLFFSFFMNQNKFLISVKNLNNKVSLFFFFNLYMMSGLIYSMSFFSKDFLIEWCFSNFNLTLFCLVMFIGSIYTITYCKILMESCMNFHNMNSSFFLKKEKDVYNKYYYYSFLFIFYLIFNYINMYNYCFIKDTIVLNLFMFTLVIFAFKKMVFMHYLVFMNFFMNFYMIINKMIYKFSLNLTLDQEFFFKFKFLMSMNYNFMKFKYINF